MRPYLLAGCFLLVSGPGCNLPPLTGVPEARAAEPRADAQADACPGGGTPVEEPPARCLCERVRLGAARLRRAVAAGYGSMSEGIESAADSEAVRTALKPLVYACLIVGFFAPR